VRAATRRSSTLGVLRPLLHDKLTQCRRATGGVGSVNFMFNLFAIIDPLCTCSGKVEVAPNVDLRPNKVVRLSSCCSQFRCTAHHGCCALLLSGVLLCCAVARLT
jgi:hypothetical protein